MSAAGVGVVSRQREKGQETLWTMQNESDSKFAHVVHDGILGNTPHGVFDVLFDKSTESGITELGRSSIGIPSTVFPKLNDFVTDDKAKKFAGQGMEGENK